MKSLKPRSALPQAERLPRHGSWPSARNAVHSPSRSNSRRVSGGIVSPIATTGRLASTRTTRPAPARASAKAQAAPAGPAPAPRPRGWTRSQRSMPIAPVARAERRRRVSTRFACSVRVRHDWRLALVLQLAPRLQVPVRRQRIAFVLDLRRLNHDADAVPVVEYVKTRLVATQSSGFVESVPDPRTDQR
jgi:hypothetical protein